MMDMLPFPGLTEETPEKQIGEILNYLIQLKETLEFAFMNISAENLSPDLVKKLNELGADIKRNNETREDDLSQISSKTLTVSDVCNSDAFKLAVKSESGKYISFNVNFETGKLEYILLNEEGN